jgi:hypothetical protein
MFVSVFITITCFLLCAEVDFAGRIGLRGWTMDLLAQYYYARHKISAALSYMYKAMAAIDQVFYMYIYKQHTYMNKCE